MKTASEYVADARKAAEVAKAKLMLLREGHASNPVEVMQSVEADVKRIVDSVGGAERAITAAAVAATDRGQKTAAMLTPCPPVACCDAPTAKMPRMAMVEVIPLSGDDVLSGTLADLIERGR